MEARNVPAFGQPILVQELADSSKWVHKSVNVTGRLDEHDTSCCRAKLVAPKSQASVIIDTTLVEPFGAKIGSMFQFIGEVIQCGGGGGGGSGGEDPVHGWQQESLMLQARVVRCCDGLDLLLYEHALKTQRDYLNSR